MGEGLCSGIPGFLGISGELLLALGSLCTLDPLWGTTAPPLARDGANDRQDHPQLLRKLVPGLPLGALSLLWAWVTCPSSGFAGCPPALPTETGFPVVTVWVEAAAALRKWESSHRVAGGVAMQPASSHHKPELT